MNCKTCENHRCRIVEGQFVIHFCGIGPEENWKGISNIDMNNDVLPDFCPKKQLTNSCL